MLFAFGIAHGLLLWSGDILAPYAVMGVFLYFFRNRSPRTLLLWAIVCFLWTLLPPAMLTLAHQSGAPVTMPMQTTPEELRRIIQVYSQGSYAQIFSERAAELLFLWTGIIFFYPRTFALFLLGLYVWRSGIVQNLPAHTSTLRRAARAGFLVGFPLSLASVVVARLAHTTPYDGTVAGLFAEVSAAVGAPFLSLFYACILTLAVLEGKRSGWMSTLAAVGRTALTNYLLQTVLATTLFYSWGLGWYGKVGPALGLLPTILIYALLALASRWWVQRYQYGPAEWLWRALTYLHRPPMRLTPPSSPTT